MALFAGRYAFVDMLGSGGMGSVWRVWDTRERRYVAAKLLRPTDAGQLLRFVRERSFKVDHPNVVAPKDWVAADEQVLFTLDIVRGGDVGQLLGDYGVVPLPYAAVLIDQLLSALTAVHALGIVHRDVKPSNLLLEATGRERPVLRLSDFGIATALDGPRLTAERQVVGTPGYLAPEVARGAEPEPRQDLYSVGVVAYQLLTGRLPGAAERADVGRDGIQRPQCIPPPVWDVIRSMMDPAPSGRPGSAAAARTRWRTAVEATHAAQFEPAANEAIEVFDQVGPLPAGFGPDGPHAGADGASDPPVLAAPAAAARRPTGRRAVATAATGALVIAVGALALSVAGDGRDRTGSPTTVTRADSWTTVTPDAQGVATIPYCPRVRPCRFPAVPQVLVTARGPQNGNGIPAGLVAYGATTAEFSLRALDQRGKPLTGRIDVWYHAAVADQRPTIEVGTATARTDDRGYAEIRYREGGRGAPVALVASGVRPTNGRRIPGSVMVTERREEAFRVRVLSHTGAVIAREWVTVAYRASWTEATDTAGYSSRDATTVITTDASGFATVTFPRPLPAVPNGIQTVGVSPAVAPGAAATVLAHSPTATGFAVRVLDAEGRDVAATTVTLSYHAVAAAPTAPAPSTR